MPYNDSYQLTLMWTELCAFSVALIVSLGFLAPRQDGKGLNSQWGLTALTLPALITILAFAFTVKTNPQQDNRTFERWELMLLLTQLTAYRNTYCSCITDAPAKFNLSQTAVKSVWDKRSDFFQMQEIGGSFKATFYLHKCEPVHNAAIANRMVCDRIFSGESRQNRKGWILDDGGSSFSRRYSL